MARSHRGPRGIPTRVFLQKSVYLLDCKGLDFFGDSKERRKRQKTKDFRDSERPQLGMFGCPGTRSPSAEKGMDGRRPGGGGRRS